MEKSGRYEVAKGRYKGNATSTQSYGPPDEAPETRTDSPPPTSTYPPEVIVIKRTDVPLMNKRDNKRTEPIGDKRTRGRPKKWASEAERKRAYRQRRSD